MRAGGGEQRGGVRGVSGGEHTDAIGGEAVRARSGGKARRRDGEPAGAFGARRAALAELGRGGIAFTGRERGGGDTERALERWHVHGLGILAAWKYRGGSAD